METPANLRADAFAGAAEAYLRFRPPYPRAMLDDLVARAAPAAGGALVDLACGPGRVALDLAGAFGAVLAIDLEPQMVAVGAREAARRGIGNVTWRVGRAEDAEIAPGSVDLITIGEAFHRLDQPAITARAMVWLKPGGCLATMGVRGPLDGGEPWEVRLASVARRWFPKGWAQGAAGAEIGPGSFERVLRRDGFIAVETRDFSEPRAWSFEALLGYLHSTSVCSLRALGDGAAAFEAELRAALGVGPFEETLTAGYTLGRKPA
jgi:SAM-dependent methyltransferase